MGIHEPGQHRIVVNIGGIANVSYLPADTNAPVIGFDTGPGNTLLDGWIAKNRKQPYDEDGRWAASGKSLATLLELLCDDPYFRTAPPKSTGVEYFDLAWVERCLAELRSAPPAEDVQATLTELTARSIAIAASTFLPKVDEVYACDGGSHNSYLMTRLPANLPNASIQTTAALGLDPDWVEAAAFAWLAHQALEGRPNNLPSVTGARHEVVLGGDI